MDGSSVLALTRIDHKCPVFERANTRQDDGETEKTQLAGTGRSVKLGAWESIAGEAHVAFTSGRRGLLSSDPRPMYSLLDLILRVQIYNKNKLSFFRTRQSRTLFSKYSMNAQ
jgi:hypothetical protein